MSIRAAVADAKVRIEGPGLELADVSADVALEGGVLSAEHAAARVGKSRASGGSVLIGLAKGDDRLRVESEVRADLAEVPAILARAIRDRSFRQELGARGGPRWKRDGAGSPSETGRARWRTSVSVSEMRFSATYGRLPWPLEVRGGRFDFDGTRIGVSAPIRTRRPLDVLGPRGARAAREQSRSRIGVRLGCGFARRFLRRCSDPPGGGGAREERPASLGLCPASTSGALRGRSPVSARHRSLLLAPSKKFSSNPLLFRLSRSRRAASPWATTPFV